VGGDPLGDLSEDRSLGESSVLLVSDDDDDVEDDVEDVPELLDGGSDCSASCVTCRKVSTPGQRP
jgi:hypothetical protein